MLVKLTSLILPENPIWRDQTLYAGFRSGFEEEYNTGTCSNGNFSKQMEVMNLEQSSSNLH